MAEKNKIGTSWAAFERCIADVAQLGERQTEDLKVPGSIPGDGTECFVFPEAPHSDLKRWFVHKKLLCFDSFCIVK